ncbi:MAG: hypothetical protein ACYDG2_23740 [Ruminiclostridium sp.]
MSSTELQDFIKDCKIKYGISHRYWAKKLGITDTFIHLWLTGQRNMSGCKCRKLESLINELNIT